MTRSLVLLTKTKTPITPIKLTQKKININLFKNFNILINVSLIYQINGAPARIRTADLLITNQLLYQLSYKGILF